MPTDLTDSPAVQTCALNGSWLDQSPPPDYNLSISNSASVGALTVSNNLGSNTTTTLGWTPWSNCWYYQPLYERRPIRLGYSEVEKLRQAAKRDAKLKAILEKFTDHIEVVVDFK